MHLLITDSRGAELGDLVRNSGKLNEHFEVRICKGATLAQLCDIATSHLQRCPFDVVYIAGGVCDITTKNEYTKLISFDWELGEELGEHLIGDLNRADSKFKKYFPASKISFCSLIGCDLVRTVNAHPTTVEQKEMVNNAVWEFNCEIFRINRERKIFSPSLHSQIHRICNGTKRNYYQHLHDGLHPSDFIKQKWATQFVKAIAHN